MGKLIKIHDIEQFCEVKTIPDLAINETILSNVKNLDEKSEMERFLREILYDPNETPHGPTEIADILTTHVNIRGNKQLAAFVLKGKSIPKVSSKIVTHQFAKLRHIQGLGLMVFGAVGNIQDDAQRDFVQIAIDGKCDYLIIDVQDWSRLLIAYEKICPKDGTSFNDSGTCKHGHVRDEGLALEMEVREKIRYTIVKLRDVSHAGAKRYSATILLDRHYPKEVIRTIIEEATKKLKYSNYYRNERIKARWGNTLTHVVWLFIAHDLEDIQNVNWICSTCWIDQSLPEKMRPYGLKGNEKLKDIEILWNDNYKSHKNFLESNLGTKEEVLGSIQPILKKLMGFANRAVEYFEEYRSDKKSEEEFISKMQKLEPDVTELYLQSGNLPTPPEDCKDYEQSCQSIFATINNMFLFYSKRGLKTWQKPNRDWLMQDTIKSYFDDLKRINFEESKIH